MAGSVSLTKLFVKAFAIEFRSIRVTVLPETLVDGLRAHRERFRRLYEEDRADDVTGVWLPEALQRKYPGAGCPGNGSGSRAV
jgi:hypothetical protein